MSNRKKYTLISIFVFILIVALLVILTLILNKDSSNNHNTTEKKLNNIIQKSNVKTLGKQGSKNQIVVFMDYRCPDCYQFHKQAQKRFNYLIEQDRINYTEVPYRVIDNKSNQYASLDKSASKYLNDMEYINFKDKAYQLAMTKDSNVKNAVSQFNQSTQKKILNDYDKNYKIDNSLGKSVNVHSTPTIFVNGKKVQSFNELNEELK